MAEPPVKIRWAPRLPPRLLERLYESDAKGFRDVELCDDVGLRLHERCRAFVLVHRFEVECPECRQVFTVLDAGESHCPEEACSWFTTQRVYRESLRNHYAYPGRAIGAFATFHRRYPTAESYKDRILLIDQLIHSFHLDEETALPVKSVASKLLEGNKTEVVRFLDLLSAIDPAEKARWRQAVSDTLHRRVVAPEETEE
jgi:hypothetical protein